MTFKRNPLDIMYITQPFNKNWAPDDLYRKLGMLGHNGIDYQAPDGTPVYAVADGLLEYEKESWNPLSNPRGYGLNARLLVDIDPLNKLEVIYAHLQKMVSAPGPVAAGDVLALSDTTGAAAGPHLHFGVRRWVVTDAATGAKQVRDYANGYFGWLDPTPFMAPVEAEFNVDRRYYQPRSMAREMLFKPSELFFRRRAGRPTTEGERNAFIYGYWPFEAVVDPAMFVIWREMTFPAYAKLLKQRPEDIARGLRGY